MALFGETRQGFVVTGFGVVIFWRLVVDGAAGYGLLFGLPPTWSIPPPPGRRGVAFWMVSGMVLLFLCNIRIPPPASRDRCSAETSTPPAEGRGVWLPTLKGWALPTPELHPHGVRNEPGPCLSCHYWLLRQSSTSVIGKSVLVESVLLLGGCWGICCLFCLEGDFQ